MEKINYDQLIDDILDINDRFTLIRGYSDIIEQKIKLGSYSESVYRFKNINSDDFWTIIGNQDQKLILESLNDLEFEVDREGEYEFIILFKYNSPEFESGAMITPGYLEVAEQKLTFIQTFEEREREVKLNVLLIDEFDNLFKYNDESIN